MEPVFLFIIFGFIGFAVWYFWPRRQKETVEPEPTSTCVAPAIHYEPVFKGNQAERLSRMFTREKFGTPQESYKDFILKQRCEKKIKDLELLLQRHGKEGFELAPKDLIRYPAMIEILKAMIN